MTSTYLQKLSTSPDTSEKNKVREFIFSHFKCSNVVGLAGPNIEKYINWCSSKGFKNIEIYENNPEILLMQLTNIHKPCKLVFGDINTAIPDKEDTFYDLDYCCTIQKVREYIPKFKRNYSITLSRRLVGTDKTIADFFKSANEIILTKVFKTTPVKHTIFTTIKGNKYIYANYWDTSAMCCITKIK